MRIQGHQFIEEFNKESESTPKKFETEEVPDYALTKPKPSPLK